MKTSYTLFLFSPLFLFSCTNSVKEEEKPNIIYILADDLGYGDLECYGQEKIKTPNIDRLAKEGMLFTQHYAGSTVCAPSRSSLLTGQHTGHTFIRGNKEVKPEGQYPLSGETLTIAEVLKKAGYSTGAFGKWGLGMVGTKGDPNSQGFDKFFGYNCQRYAHRYYPAYLWDNNVKVYLEGNNWEKKVTYAPDVIHEEAKKFLMANKDKPFFLYLPYTIPHAELVAPEDSFLMMYKGMFEETPFGTKNPPTPNGGNDYGDEDFDIRGYARQKTPRAVFAAMVSRLDHQVGEIMDIVDKSGLNEKTIIIFTSDNGPHMEGGADPDFFNSNGIFKGYKRDLYEGGIRVPMILKWTGKVKAGSTTDHISAFWDILPTFSELSGQKVPDNIDGISFLPVILGKEGQKEHDYLYWEFHELGGRQVVRKGDWKLVRYNVQVAEEFTTELYNLSDDPSEENNLAEVYTDKVEELLSIMKEARVPSDVFEFNPEY